MISSFSRSLLALIYIVSIHTPVTTKHTCQHLIKSTGLLCHRKAEAYNYKLTSMLSRSSPVPQSFDLTAPFCKSSLAQVNYVGMGSDWREMKSTWFKPESWTLCRWSGMRRRWSLWLGGDQQTGRGDSLTGALIMLCLYRVIMCWCLIMFILLEDHMHPKSWHCQNWVDHPTS